MAFFGKMAPDAGFEAWGFCRVLTIPRQMAHQPLVRCDSQSPRALLTPCHNDERHCSEIVEKDCILRRILLEH